MGESMGGVSTPSVEQREGGRKRVGSGTTSGVSKTKNLTGEARRIG